MAAAAAQRAGAAAPPSTSGAGDASQRATIDSPSALQHGSTRRVPSSSRTQDTKQRRASLPATPTRGVPLAEPRRHHLEDEPAHLGLGLAIPHNSTDDPDAQVVEPSSFPSLSSPLARTSFLPQAREHRDDLPSLSEVGEGEQPTQMAHQHRRRASVTSITSTSTTLGGAGGSSRRSRIPRRSFDSPTGSRRPLTIVPPPPSASVGCGSTTRSVSSERASPISGKAARGKRSLLDVRSLPSSPHIPPNSAMSIRLPSLHHSASLGLLASDQPAIAEGDSALSTSPPEHQPASPESIRPSRARVSSAPGSATLGRATTKKARVAVGPPASARGRMMPQMQERVRGASMPIPRYTGTSSFCSAVLMCAYTDAEATWRSYRSSCETVTARCARLIRRLAQVRLVQRRSGNRRRLASASRAGWRGRRGRLWVSVRRLDVFASVAQDAPCPALAPHS